MQQVVPTEQKRENAFLSLLFNVLIPVLILNKLSLKLGPLPALVVALAFPICYGIYDFVSRKHINPISALGLLNVLFTGGLAVLGVTGIWFAVKEAAFPLIVGLFVFGSAFTKKPFIKTLLMNPQVVKVESVQQKLKERGTELEFDKHIKKSTIFLSLSFLLSAILNFSLALRIFIPMAEGLDENARNVALNEQIAEMTSLSLVVIMVPSIIFLLGILWHLLRGIGQSTGLKVEEILNS